MTTLLQRSERPLDLPAGQLNTGVLANPFDHMLERTRIVAPE